MGYSWINSLVDAGGLKGFLFSSPENGIIPNDKHTFQGGRNHQPFHQPFRKLLDIPFFFHRKLLYFSGNPRHRLTFSIGKPTFCWNILDPIQEAEKTADISDTVSHAWQGEDFSPGKPGTGFQKPGWFRNYFTIIILVENWYIKLSLLLVKNSSTSI